MNAMKTVLAAAGFGGLALVALGASTAPAAAATDRASCHGNVTIGGVAVNPGLNYLGWMRVGQSGGLAWVCDNPHPKDHRFQCTAGQNHVYVIAELRDGVVRVECG